MDQSQEMSPSTNRRCCSGVAERRAEPRAGDTVQDSGDVPDAVSMIALLCPSSQCCVHHFNALAQLSPQTCSEALSNASVPARQRDVAASEPLGHRGEIWGKSGAASSPCKISFRLSLSVLLSAASFDCTKSSSIKLLKKKIALS